MSDNRSGLTWQSLANPFPKISKRVPPAPPLRGINTVEVITGHVSGRRTDITRIITDEQGAIFLAGTPRIGKTTLLRYLQRPPTAEWSWRNELADLSDQLNLNDIHFVQIDLTPLEGLTDPNEVLNAFIRQCIHALHLVYQSNDQLPPALDLKALRGLLRTIGRKTPYARYFVMLDAIERLATPGIEAFQLAGSKAETPQERALALLERSNAIRTLVDLLDEFTIFGVILSVESLPRPKIDDQFHHISADLARFTTMTLQAFTWDDTVQLLAQAPENFGSDWAKMFRWLGGSDIFSKSEQEWLRRQAGTHPYLLQQFCLHTFRFKQEYASIHKSWSHLQESDKSQLTEAINESLITFLPHVWQRLQEAVEGSTPETKGKFNDFISELEYKRADVEIDPTFWYDLGPELRYILYSEGIVRYDRPQPIHFPGSTLSQYLIQKAKENSERSPMVASGIKRMLTISRPGNPPESLQLSDLEYHLFKTLLQHPKRCTEEELMKGAWGKVIDRSPFTQRMHHLRKKLRDSCEGIEIIENRYGGIYSLTHPEWFQLQ